MTGGEEGGVGERAKEERGLRKGEIRERKCDEVILKGAGAIQECEGIMSEQCLLSIKRKGILGLVYFDATNMFSRNLMHNGWTLQGMVVMMMV